MSHVAFSGMQIEKQGTRTASCCLLWLLSCGKCAFSIVTTVQWHARAEVSCLRCMNIVARRHLTRQKSWIGHCI